MEPDQLSIEEEAWLSFRDEWAARGLPGTPGGAASFHNGLRTGQQMERSRIRRELLATVSAMGFPDAAGRWVIVHQDVVDALDRICPDPGTPKPG